MEREELRDYKPIANQPSFRDVDDAQKETIDRMKVFFEKEKTDLQQSLFREEARRTCAEDNLNTHIKNTTGTIRNLERNIKEKENEIEILNGEVDKLKKEISSLREKPTYSNEVWKKIEKLRVKTKK